MIKLSRPQEPQILQSNKSSWTSELITAIATYKGYSNIPNSEKERIFAKYNHPAIKSVLFASSNLKCGFCECIPSDGGNIEIEHFYPKSRYPNLTFEWGNYLPACRKCNGTKLSHDTGIEPLINPYDDNPKVIFDYSDILMTTIPGPSQNVGDTTIKVCGLNSTRLLTPRAQILVALRQFIIDLSAAILEYSASTTPQKRLIRLRNINEAIERIENFTKPSEKYSAFCSSFLEKEPTFLSAKAMIATNNLASD